jgi:hypothetical protein
MFKKNLLLAVAFVAVLFMLYKLCVFIGLPLYPYGMALFVIPILGLIPVYHYLEDKQLNGYKQHLLSTGQFTPEQVHGMSTQEIELNWRKSLNKP